MHTSSNQTISIVMGLLGVLCGALNGSLLGYFIAMRHTGVHLHEVRGVFNAIITPFTLAPKGMLLGALLGGCLILLAYFIFHPDISVQSN